MNEFDDELRDALNGGPAAGPTPPRPSFDDVRRRAHRAQRSRRLAAGGALAAVLLITGVTARTLTTDDDPEETDVVTEGDDTTTTSTESTTPAPSMSSATVTTVVAPVLEVPPPGARPEQIVAVDEHGRLVVVDAATGEVIRQLDAEGDPTEPISPEDQIAPNILDDVALSPDGVVYYTSVGEPVSGNVRRIGMDGTLLDGDERYWSEGNDVAVRPDGAAVARVFNADVGITPTSSGPFPSATSQLFGPWVTADGGQLGAVDWSRDGRFLAVQRLAWNGGPPTHYDVLVAPAGGAGPDTTAVLRADGDDRTYGEPAFRRDGALVVAEQDWCRGDNAPDACGNAIARVFDPTTTELLASFEYGNASAVVDQSYDATGTWLLVTFEDGALRWFGSGETGTVPGRYRAADW